MTKDQLISLQLFKQNGVSVDYCSFAVTYYPTAETLLRHEYVSVPVTFPSVRAAVCYMEDVLPHVYFYDVNVVTNLRSNCPCPYNQVK